MMKILCRVFVLLTLITLGFYLIGEAYENPKERIDFWQKNFDELQPDQDSRAKNAHEIFHRLLDVAGKKPGVIPRLFIVKSDSPYIPLAFALPDGGIIISKGVLDICYKDPERGSDRLAFILAHEIAHQLKDDFWHLKFFQAVDLSKKKDLQQEEILKEVRDIASQTDKVLAKELQADEYGIIYASMAGFNTSAIVMEDDKVNFFEYFYQSLDPENIKGFQKDPTHPTPMQRAETVKARLRQILEKVDLFNLGVIFYQAGDYQRAILFFSEFLRFFPSREVYHNLASSHHQLALKYYQEWKGDNKSIPFKLSIAVDPETRASKITLRGGTRENPEVLFKKHIEKAIEYYQTAISLDPSYILSYSNLACALIVKEKDNVNKAIGLLKDALKISPNPWEKEVLNNLGVALYLDEKPNRAKEHLLKANGLDKNYEAPLFNLGKIALETGKQKEAKEFWLAYLKLDEISPWADTIRKALSLNAEKKAPSSNAEKINETVLGVKIGSYDDDVQKEWGKPQTKEIALGEEIALRKRPYLFNTYKNQVMTLSQMDEIKLIVTSEGFKGKTEKGISVGSAQKDILSAYGIPSNVLDMTQGTSWVYDSQGITFQLRDGRVVSWLLY
jgi:tetratricopeptide (TPR) repeat protein